MSELRIPCPHCGMPDQNVDLHCGFCGCAIPAPVQLPDGTIPQVVEIIGYKGLDVRNGGESLWSPVYPQKWHPGQWAIAECRGGYGQLPEPDHHGSKALDPARWAPVKDCGCGFYAGRTREHLMTMGYHNYTDDHPSIIAKVQLAGKIIPASNGWRAQKARLLTLYVPYEHWQIGERLEAVYGPYGTVVELSSTLLLPKDQAREWCEKCGAKMGRQVECAFCGYEHI